VGVGVGVGVGAGAGSLCPGAGSGDGVAGRLSLHATVTMSAMADAMMTVFLDCMVGLPSFVS
jgi:hypothetical protein